MHWGLKYGPLMIFLFPLMVHGGNDTDPSNADLDSGRRIFREGLLQDGTPIEASREAGVQLKGKEAACINCHRQSGMGRLEGRVFVPPITEAFLFHPEKRPMAVTDPSHPMGISIGSTRWQDEV